MIFDRFVQLSACNCQLIFFFLTNFVWLSHILKWPLAVMGLLEKETQVVWAAIKVAFNKRQGNNGAVTKWEWVLLCYFCPFWIQVSDVKLLFVCSTQPQAPFSPFFFLFLKTESSNEAYFQKQKLLLEKLKQIISKNNLHKGKSTWCLAKYKTSL